MNRLLTLSVFSVATALSGPAFLAAAPPVESLGQAGLQEAFRLLRGRYIRSSDLTPLALNRAALSGVLDSLDFGAELITGPASPEPSYTAKFGNGTLPGGAAYLRPAALDAAELPAFESALSAIGASSPPPPALVLDLRAPARHGSFEIAAAYADRLLPPGVPLFRLVGSAGEPPRTFHSTREPVFPSTVPIKILTDADSNNVAETLAALLKKHRAAFLIGGTTPGRTVEYETVPLGNGTSLRLATAEMLLEDGTSLFRSGLVPDLELPGDPVMKAAFFTAGDKVPPAAFVTESQRPRFNEAALVHGTFPELEYLATRTAGAESPIDRAPLVDPVLQRAAELVTATAALAAPAAK